MWVEILGKCMKIRTRLPRHIGASSTVEDEKEKNTIGGDPQIWAPIVGKSSKAARKKNEKRERSRTMKIDVERKQNVPPLNNIAILKNVSFRFSRKRSRPTPTKVHPARVP